MLQYEYNSNVKHEPFWTTLTYFNTLTQLILDGSKKLYINKSSKWFTNMRKYVSLMRCFVLEIFWTCPKSNRLTNMQYYH